MRNFTIGISLTLAITAVTIITIMTSSQRESSASNRTMMTISNANLTSKAANTTETRIATNIKNVSIVPEAAALEDKAYRPNPVSIKVGETVIWTNNDLTIHTVTEGNPSTNVPTNGFDSGLLNPDETFKYVFEKAGTIQYHCILHPAMIGSVIISNK
jgi:plastocyanin